MNFIASEPTAAISAGIAANVDEVVLDFRVGNYSITVRIEDGKFKLIILRHYRSGFCPTENHAICSWIAPESNLEMNALVGGLAELLNFGCWTVKLVRSGASDPVRIAITRKGWLIVLNENSLTYDPIDSIKQLEDNAFEINGKVYKIFPWLSISEPESNRVNSETFPSKDMFNVIAIKPFDESRRPLRYRLHGNPNSHDSIIIEKSTVEDSGGFTSVCFFAVDIVPGSISADERGFWVKGMPNDSSLGRATVFDIVNGLKVVTEPKSQGDFELYVPYM